jgi:ABC-type multidrug transport system fused ATPase/permease subunit
LPPWPGPRRARREFFVVRAKVVPDRVIRRRSIRVICAGPPAPRRVLRNRGLTVVAVPADTGYTIRLENAGTGVAHDRPLRRGTDRPRHDRLPSAQSRSSCSACRPAYPRAPGTLARSQMSAATPGAGDNPWSACTRPTGTTVAVEDVSFSVRHGEIFGVLGRNGAGKTTTVECISGLRA